MVNAINIFLNVVDNATNKVKKVEKQIQGFGKKIENNFKKIQNAFLGVGLSLLFTGMALKRVADSALRSIFETAQLAYGEVSEFAVLTNQLSANWSFFKFTLVDALMQSGLFQMFIGFLVSVVQALSNLSPGMKRFLVISLVVLSAVSGLMMIVGQTALGFLAILTIVGTAGGAALLPILIAVGAITLGIIALAMIWSSSMSNIKKIALSVAVIFGVLIAIIGFFPAVLALAFGLIIAGLIFIAKRWEVIWINMQMVFQRIMFNLGKVFESFVNMVIEALNWLIRKANRLPGINIGLITGGVDFTSDNMASMRDLVRQREAAESRTSTTNIGSINIEQKEGEDSEGLAQRVADIISNQTDRMIQSPQRGAGQ